MVTKARNKFKQVKEISENIRNRFSLGALTRHIKKNWVEIKSTPKKISKIEPKSLGL